MTGKMSVDVPLQSFSQACLCCSCKENGSAQLSSTSVPSKANWPKKISVCA